MYSLGRRYTTQRMFEKRYGVPYQWMIKQDHCNTADEVVAELLGRFRVLHRSFFPFHIPAIDLNLTLGFELSLR